MVKVVLKIRFYVLETTLTLDFIYFIMQSPLYQLCDMVGDLKQSNQVPEIAGPDIILCAV